MTLLDLREGGREGGGQEDREGGREGGRQEDREGGREGGRGAERQRGRERGKEGNSEVRSMHINTEYPSNNSLTKLLTN